MTFFARRRSQSRRVRVASKLVLLAVAAQRIWAHDAVTTKLTFNGEIIRIIQQRCGSCHRDGGSAPMSLLTYEEARPWAKAIKEEVLERRMPPWGAVKGFGEFAGDQALTAEELHVIADWVEGGAPEGDPSLLPMPKRWDNAAPPAVPRGTAASDGWTLRRAITLRSIRAEGLSKDASAKIVAQLPDGAVEPLLWVHGFNQKFGPRTYVLREPLAMPAGTKIRIAPASAGRAILIEAPSRER